jgi:hypothetical protein
MNLSSFLEVEPLKSVKAAEFSHNSFERGVAPEIFECECGEIVLLLEESKTSIYVLVEDRVGGLIVPTAARKPALVANLAKALASG